MTDQRIQREERRAREVVAVALARAIFRNASASQWVNDQISDFGPAPLGGPMPR